MTAETNKISILGYTIIPGSILQIRYAYGIIDNFNSQPSYQTIPGGLILNPEDTYAFKFLVNVSSASCFLSLKFTGSFSLYANLIYVGSYQSDTVASYSFPYSLQGVVYLEILIKESKYLEISFSGNYTVFYLD